MIVWGGDSDHIDQAIGTGGTYDPGTDTWTATTTTGEPSAREYTTAVWAGSRMIVWGGISPWEGVNTGGVYEPATDSWTATSTHGAPTARSGHTAVWTGTRMIVWGGWDSSLTMTGSLYDPSTDTWTATSTNGAPIARAEHTAVWTGTRMIVWGGHFGWTDTGTRVYTNTGGIYDPQTDTWTAMSYAGAPSPRGSHAAVWTGSKMIVWGGINWGGDRLNTGGIYDPVTDTWTAMSTVAAASPAYGPVVVWTGRKMIAWGGADSSFKNTGAVYDPVTDTWGATSLTAAPSPRRSASGLWTGTAMIVWGGETPYPSPTNTGGLFYPDRVRASLDAAGDGTEDVVLRQDTGSLNLLSSDGTALANLAWGGGLPSSVYDVYYADVTGDGRADLVSRHRTSGDVEVRASTGADFTWTPGSGPGGVWSYGWTTSYDLLLADVTGDGKADLVGWKRGTGDVYVFPSSGEGFDSAAAALWSYGWRRPQYEVYLADVTGDLRADLVIRYVGLPAASLETGDVFVAVSSGTAFGPPARWTYGFSAGYELSLADADGDGRADLVGRYVGAVFPLGSGGDVWVMCSTGTRFSWNGPAYRWSYGWGAAYDVVLRDVTGDGRADLVGRLRHNGELYVAPSAGTRFSFEGAWATGIDPTWQLR
jgi:N-acetylneuraminic acid mutarotase